MQITMVSILAYNSKDVLKMYSTLLCDNADLDIKTFKADSWLNI